jgi:hypothetical protein
MNLILDIADACARISYEARKIRQDHCFYDRPDTYTIADGDLLTAELNLEAALKEVKEALALRPRAHEVQREIDERLNRLAGRAA